MSRPFPPIRCDTDTCEQRLAVSFDYPVCFTRDVFATSNPVLADVLRRGNEPVRPALVYLDDGLVRCHPHLPEAVGAYARAHPDALALARPARSLPGGEMAKAGWDVVNEVLADLQSHRLCRHSLVLVAGGGALLDAVGLAASLFHRGVRLVRLPSTTLAQDDSGVGVKNGINLHGTKNLVGAFAPPYGVINDDAFLRTLPHDVMLDGVAEAFKVALIKDADFFAFLEDAADDLNAAEPAAVARVVRRSALIHLAHLRQSGDAFERGTARPLDFGHWSAHWLESASGYQVRHGQAVAVGIALDTWCARRMGYVTDAEFKRILTALTRVGLPIWHGLLGGTDEAGRPLVAAGLEQFREHLGGSLSVTLPRGIGGMVEVGQIDTELVREGVTFLATYGGTAR